MHTRIMFRPTEMHGVAHEALVFITLSSNVGPREYAHMHRLKRAFAACKNKV